MMGITQVKMFRFVDVGEQAGTSIPRIFQRWHVSPLSASLRQHLEDAA